MFDWINPLQFNRPSTLCAQDLLSYSVSNREKVQRSKNSFDASKGLFNFVNDFKKETQIEIMPV